MHVVNRPHSVFFWEFRCSQWLSELSRSRRQLCCSEVVDVQLDRSRRDQTQTAIAAIVIVFLLLPRTVTPAFASSIEDVESGQTYRVSRIVITGNKALSDDELLSQMGTKQQPYYMIWKQPPKFDRDVFATDL